MDEKGEREREKERERERGTHTHTNMSVNLPAGTNKLLERYLIHIGWILLDDVLLLQHLVGLSNFDLMWQALVPAVQQLNASLLHPLCCLPTQVLQKK